MSAVNALQATYGPPAKDPFAASVLFLLRGEGPTDGVQVNPPTGTLLKDEVSGNLMGLGNAPFTTGSTVSASTVGMPFGNSWIRMPGGLTSHNMVGISGYSNRHPPTEVFCYDCWYQLDYLDNNVQALLSDDTAFGGGNWNINIDCVDIGSGGYVNFSMIRWGVGVHSVASAPGSISAGVPFHLEAWGDGAGNVGIAINGVQVTNVAPASVKCPNASGLLIGAQNHWVGGYSRVMTGYFKCARMTAAVRHTGNFTPPSSLAAYKL